MRVVTLVIHDGDPWYGRAAKVLAASVAATSPGVQVHIIADDAPEHELCSVRGRGVRPLNYVMNTRKTYRHRDTVASAQDGELICFMDADTLVLRDLNDAEELTVGKDVIITERGSSNKFMFNSGVVFCRVSDRVREMYRRWANAAIDMLLDPAEHAKYRRTYGGINQSAFGCLLETGQLSKLGIKVGKIPNVMWNALTVDHRVALSKGYVVHLLGSTREATKRYKLNTVHRCPSAKQDLVRRWLEYDAQTTVPIPVR